MTFAITAASPFNGQYNTPVASNVVITVDRSLNLSTITGTTVELLNEQNQIVPSLITYNATTRQITIDPTTNLPVSNGFYTVKLASGPSGVRASDGQQLNGDFRYTFTTGRPGFQEQTLFQSRVTSPTALRFASDGRVFVAEKSGIVRVFSSAADTSNGTVFADLRTSVHNFWDRGLLGLELHPNFPQTPFVYVLYTYDADRGQTAPKFGIAGATNDPDVPNSANSGTATVSGRLSRLTASGNTAVANSERVLINDWETQFPSHSVGDLKFGPDGFLYATGGDGASFNFVDTGQTGNPFNEPAGFRGALRSQSVLNINGDTKQSGTFIRIDPETGLGVAGNPYFGQAGRDAEAQRSIAFGLRNPYRFAFRPGTNEAYIADVGWNAWEEINRVTSLTPANSAQNFGWPAFEGSVRQPGYAATNNATLTFLYDNPSLTTQPFYAYRHDTAVVPGSGEPTGGSAITGIAFYPDQGVYPTSMQGALFFADFARNRIWFMTKGPDGQINPASRQTLFNGNQPVDLQVGPDGLLYYTSIYTNSIRRLNFTGTNRPPIANLTAAPTSGSAPLTVSFSAVGSSDPDPNQTLSYAWDLDGDGDFDDSIAPTVNYVYSAAGNYFVRLRVTDSLGLSDVVFTDISANNTAPVARIDSPNFGANWFVGQTINLTGSATDAEEGTIPGTRLRWSVNLIHGNEIDPTNFHSHAITSFTGATGSFSAPDHEWPSWIELRLTATDASGLTNTAVRRFDPRTASLNFTSSPSGLSVSVNGANFVTPFSRTVIAGSTNTIEGLSPQVLSGVSYAFDSWNIGGSRGQNYVAPTSGNASLLATYSVPPPPLAPSGFRVVAIDPWFVDLAWNDNSTNETAFVVERRDNGGNWAVVNSQITRNSVTYRDFGVRPGNSYQYRVSAAGTGESSAPSATASAQTPSITPPPPSALTAVAVASGRVELNWRDNSPNESGFIVQRRFGTDAWMTLSTQSANATRYLDTTTIAGTSYTYRVFAQNFAGDSIPTNEVVVDTAQIQLTPSQATGLRGTIINSTRIDLSWSDNSTTEAGFRVERRIATTGTYVVLGTLPSNITTFTDNNAVLLEVYDYRIIAFNASGNAPSSNVVTIGTVNPAIPAAASALTATSTDWTVSIDWTDNADNDTRYVLQRRAGNGTQWVNRIILTGNTESYVDIDVVPGATYIYRVLAGNDVGNGAPSNETTVTTRSVSYPYLPDTPADLRALATGPTNIRLNWLDNSVNETGFRVQRRQGGEFVNIATLPAGANTYDDTSVLASQTYEYRITAFNAVSEKIGYYYTQFVTTPRSGGAVEGDGLAVTYFNNIDFTGTSVTRVDSTINFNWQTGSPDSRIAPTTFSARYTGEVLIPTTGTYTFSTDSDDGTRLWINDQQIINRWQDQGPTEINATPITLTGGQRYTIRLDYYNNGGGASNRLRWTGPGISRQIIPRVNLFSGVSADIARRLDGTIIGTGGSFQNNPNTSDRAFDGDLATIYDAPIPLAWIGLDLGFARSISEIRYAPRGDLPGRMVGGRFQVSNDPLFLSGIVDIGGINTAPAANTLTQLAVSVQGTWRYVRYLAPDNGWGNIAELEFYGQ